MDSFSSEFHRVIRSVFPADNELIVMRGELFNDGLDRYVVSYNVDAEHVFMLEEALIMQEEARAKLDATIKLINLRLVNEGERL